MRLIGSGATTVTYKALNSCGQVVAVKVLEKTKESMQFKINIDDSFRLASRVAL